MCESFGGQSCHSQSFATKSEISKNRLPILHMACQLLCLNFACANDPAGLQARKLSMGGIICARHDLWYLHDQMPRGR